MGCSEVEEKDLVVKSRGEYYILRSQYQGHGKGSDKSCREEIGFTLFNPGLIKHLTRFKFSPAKPGQPGHWNLNPSELEEDAFRTVNQTFWSNGLFGVWVSKIVATAEKCIF